MQGKHQYINSIGQVVTEDEAIDKDGTLRQGMGIRTVLQIADAAPYQRSGYQWGDQHSGTADAALDQRTLAYDAMCRANSEAWRHPLPQPNVTDARPPARTAAPTSIADAQSLRDSAWREYCVRVQNAWMKGSPA